MGAPRACGSPSQVAIGKRMATGPRDRNPPRGSSSQSLGQSERQTPWPVSTAARTQASGARTGVTEGGRRPLPADPGQVNTAGQTATTLGTCRGPTRAGSTQVDANTEWKYEKKHGLYRLEIESIKDRFPVRYEGRRKFARKNLTNKP